MMYLEGKHKMHLNNDYEAEISFKDLIFHVLYRWRSILLCMLIGAALLGSYKYVTMTLSPEGEGFTQEKYQDEEALNRFIQDQITAVELQNRYLEESVLINLDSTSVWTASKKFVVLINDSVFESLPQGYTGDPADSVLPVYSSLFSNVTEEELFSSFSTSELTYAKELVGVEIDTTENSISLSARGASKEDAERGMDFLVRKIEERDKLAQQIDSHSLVLIDEEIVCAEDQGLLSRQIEKQTQLDKSYEEAKTAIEKAQKALGKLNTPKQVVKMGIIGAFVGAFLSVMVYIVIYLVKDSLTDSDMLSEQYEIPLFGEFKRSGSLHGGKGSDKLFSRWELGKNPEKEETVFNRIGAMISNLKEEKSVVLVSTLPEAVIGPVEKSL